MTQNNLDNKLLSIFQRISDFTQIWIGITCINIAHIFFAFALIGDLMMVVGSMQLHHYIYGSFLLLWIPFYWFSVYKLMQKIEKESKNNPEYKNSLEIRFAFLRTFAIYFTVFSLISYLVLGGHHYNQKESLMGQKLVHEGNELWKYTYFFAIYFASCTPKPPRSSKVKNFLKNLFSSILLKPAMISR
jgi:hypothetical protein